MKLLRALGWILSLAAQSLPAVVRAAGDDHALSPYVVADPSAPLVTLARALDSERFWPERVALTRDWTAPSGARLAAGSSGVLIRVEPGGSARVDYGRDGLFTLPLALTDFLARANALRSGAATKLAPNLSLALGPRLVDATGEAPRVLAFSESAATAAYLAVFSASDARELAAIASALAPRLRGLSQLRLALFPMERRSDAEVHARLHALGWPGAFVMDHLAEPYARTLVDGELPTPRMMLFSAEGRALWAGGLSEEIPSALEAALDEIRGNP